MSQQQDNEPRHAIVRALKMILRPLTRLLIRQQLTYPYVRELLKEIYVEEAGKLIEQDGEKSNFSRLFILTGVHRKDIKRLTEQREDESHSDSNQSLGAMLIARWLGMTQYLDSTGKPRALAFTGTDEQPGFEQLVTELSKDIRPRAILDEWLRQGLVQQEDDLISLNQDAFIPGEDFSKLSDYLGKQVHDHLASAIHNLMSDGEPRFERSVYYRNLSAESVNQLHQIARQKGSELLQNLNQQAIQFYEQDRNSEDATHRFRLGCYWYDGKIES